jgi:hypothetical protein
VISAALLSSASPDWWTPPHILEASREALGGRIDLDPCANDGPPNVPARTDTAWFRPLFRFPIAFLAGRLRFIDGSGRARDPAPFPSAVALLKAEIAAEDLARFRGAFGLLGAVVDGGRS